jgi:hypothetical protein
VSSLRGTQGLKHNKFVQQLTTQVALPEETGLCMTKQSPKQHFGGLEDTQPIGHLERSFEKQLDLLFMAVSC